jgi:hypothetical protein
MQMLCLQCNAHNLVFSFGEVPPTGGRPPVIDIKCNPIGTGVLTQCKYIPGSVVFTLTATLYWIYSEHEKVLEKTRTEFAESVSRLLSDLYHEIRKQNEAEVERKLREARMRKKRDTWVDAQLDPDENG